MEKITIVVRDGNVIPQPILFGWTCSCGAGNSDENQWCRECGSSK